MKKRLLILMTVTGMIILLGGLLTYGLGVHEIIPVPRPDLIVVGTSSPLISGISMSRKATCIDDKSSSSRFLLEEKIWQSYSTCN